MARESIGGLDNSLAGLFQSRDGLKEFLEVLLDQVMRTEVAAHVGADRHERAGGRRGYRNGVKARSLSTRVGALSLSVPQVRGCQPYHPSLFSRWQRSERALLTTCAEMYFQGVSTRQVRKVLEAMCGGEISATTVSQVAAELDEKLSAFRERRLDGQSYVYLMIDARYEKVRVGNQVVSQAVLVTMGITGVGRREMLDWRVADSESAESWSELFVSLKSRGLQGVKLVTSDAHRGIRKALGRHFQGVAWQRCKVHFKRELARKVSHKRMKEAMKDLAVVMGGADKSVCLALGEEMALKWEKEYPSVSKMLREGLEDCLSVLALPENHRRKLWSTNLLENLMKQLRRRTAVVGVFPSRASCERLIGARLLEIHEKWLLEERPYMNLENASSAKEASPTAAAVGA